MDVLRETSSREGLNGLSSAHSGRAVYNGGKIPASPLNAENKTHPAMPLGFQGMLKTSTETGDIGQFSIKPPRVPHHPAALQNQPSPWRRFPQNGTKYSPDRPPPERYPNFHLMGDDRRRLPSYQNLMASDTVSLYDTTSQKSTPRSGRPFKDTEYRAFSMTTSSYAPVGISSTHHSYASLRSQPEPITQRPRSPFLYPARLKRPGFRPSSPLLSDSGVDYSRRAEIERPLVPPVPPHMTNGTLSSPSSYYTHKRGPPPLSVRTDVNRSNPSPRKPRSPTRNQAWQIPAASDDSFREFTRRKDAIEAGDVSPAKSNHSYASTVNHYRSGPPASTTTTPSRLHPPSPLYYDYTEEFESEEFSEQIRDDAPPPFQLEKTIHEDRPLSTGWQSMETSEVRGAQPRFNSGHSIRSSTGELVTEFDMMRKQPLLAIRPSPDTGPVSKASSILSGAGDSLENLVRMYENEVENADYGLDEVPNGELRSRNEQMAQSDIPTIAELPAEPVNPNSSSNFLPDFDDLGGGNMTDRSSEYSLSSNLPMNYPKPPAPLPPLPLLVDKGTGNGPHLNKKLPVRPSQKPFSESDAPQMVASAAATSRVDYRRHKHQRSASTQSGYYRSSKVSLDPGLTDLAQLVSTFEAAKARGDFGWSINGPNQPMRKSLTFNDILSAGSAPMQKGEQRPLKQYRSESHLSGQGHKAGRHGYQEPHKFAQATLEASTNSKTPMFAPKPISPARVAKLKTTVPQLMKALPALPQGSLRAVSPPSTLQHEASDLPFRFSPLMRPTPPPPEPVELDSSPIAELPPIPQPPPKLKVRLRKAGSTPVLAPSDSPRPWNLDESYPWGGEPSFRLGPGAVNKQTNKGKSPRFKLKISRPSVSSIETVHIKRNTSESRESLGLENPTDLFTAPSRQHGLHALFSKVSGHFSNSKKGDPGGKSIAMRTLRPQGRMELSLNNTSSSDRGSSLDIPQLQIPMRAAEARSFFSDDSSQVQGNHSLRKRVANLRARLPTPYSSRTSTMATRSYDDIVYRHNGAEATTELPEGDFKIDNETIAGDEMNTGSGHRRRLRSAVSGWLGRAKHLMTGYIKPRSQRNKDQAKGSNDV